MNEQAEFRGHDLILNSLEEWSEMLRLFTKASCLMASMYLPDGKRILGPFNGAGFGEYLKQTKKFEDGGFCHQYEREKILATGKVESGSQKMFTKALDIRVIPVKIENHTIAYVIFGWMFSTFPDPLECHKIARVLHQNEVIFWQSARMQAPITTEKISTYEAMLKLICSTLIGQLISLRQAAITAKLKDELLATVSHELKTPLTSILLRIQMLKKNMVKPERIVEFASSLEASARVQAQLIEDLLDAAKVITGKFVVTPSLIDLREILQVSVATVGDSAHAKNITIECSGFENNSLFVGDPLRLQQAFCNLLTNSVKFTPSNGQIQVKLTQNISSYTIRFSDNGTGIDPTFMPNLFKKFSQHESKIGLSQAGLGLGLSLVKTIIDLHHGSIEVESAGLGKGTTFEISLSRDKQLQENQVEA